MPSLLTTPCATWQVRALERKIEAAWKQAVGETFALGMSKLGAANAKKAA